MTKKKATTEQEINRARIAAEDATKVQTLADWLDAQAINGMRYDFTEKEYVEIDYLGFARRLIAEAVMDKLYYLINGKNDGNSGAVARHEKSKIRCNSVIRHTVSDEIGNEKRRRALGEVMACETEVEFLRSEMAAMQQLYRDRVGKDGDDYVPYGQRGQRGNVRPVDLPDDIAGLAAELGIAI